MKTQHSKSQAGFTLVELAVAVVILGIAIALAVPSFRGTLDRARVDQVESELQSDLRLAISTAKASGRAVRFQFSTGGYTLVDAADSTRVIRDRSFSGGVVIAASGNPLVFPWGMVQPADITLSHGADVTDLQILPTGRIEDVTPEVVN